MSASAPIHHLLRVRTVDDLSYARPGLQDELLINANLLEHQPQAAAAAIAAAGVPYSIDPLLTRFQVPGWWQNDEGEFKGNYVRLGQAYTDGTGINLPSGPLMELVASAADWRQIAGNVIHYQEDRLLAIRPQLGLFDGPLVPARLFAPGLVAYGSAEDGVNALLAEASAEAAQTPVSLQVVVPASRLRDPGEVAAMMSRVPTDGVAAYFVWTPWVSEDSLLGEPEIFAGLLQLVRGLASRGIPVGHLHGTYLTMALREVGISALAHHLGWIDKGQPADSPKGGIRSCQTYVPGVRRAVRFERARELGRDLGAAAFADLYCDCSLCVGFFENGQHPVDLLLEETRIPWGTGTRRTPTSRAVGFNTWHFLLARRAEIEAFSASSALDVIRDDMARSGRLADQADVDRLAAIGSRLSA